jgi:hypothetical protein
MGVPERCRAPSLDLRSGRGASCNRVKNRSTWKFRCRRTVRIFGGAAGWRCPARPSWSSVTEPSCGLAAQGLNIGAFRRGEIRTVILRPPQAPRECVDQRTLLIECAVA